jgi:hypothetical protein
MQQFDQGSTELCDMEKANHDFRRGGPKVPRRSSFYVPVLSLMRRSEGAVPAVCIPTLTTSVRAIREDFHCPTLRPRAR